MPDTVEANPCVRPEGDDRSGQARGPVPAILPLKRGILFFEEFLNEIRQSKCSEPP